MTAARLMILMTDTPRGAQLCLIGASEGASRKSPTHTQTESEEVTSTRISLAPTLNRNPNAAGPDLLSVRAGRTLERRELLRVNLR